MNVRKILCGLGFILFLLFAWFQRNDIDPEVYYKPSGIDATLWVVFYILIAAVFGVAFFRPAPTWLLSIAVLACLAEMALSGPGLVDNLFGEKDFTVMQQSMTAEDPRVELSREFFGALIALVAITVLWCKQGACCSKKKAKNE
ncbi:MAG: hypothetical protein HKN23_13545 [Verrucomicrobiales bacterium]|nr:hypothetical protein [Verrucomicrobiales bacterium]